MKSLPELAGRKVLVTGAAGCIGAWVVKLLRGMEAEPVVFDIADRRDRLDLIMEGAADVTWETGDIRDYDQLADTIARHGITAIIHLAALQVPFCKADPVNSTAINVLGSAHILECARQAGIRRLAYASSIAAPAMGDNPWLSTLYGAHKVCGEQMAAVYWQDWQLPSVGIRPAIIYGPGRDQGMSAAPTVAMLAAHRGQAYQVPFQGEVSFVHVEDAALRFITAVSREGDGSHVFDMNGTVAAVSSVNEMIQECLSTASLGQAGDPMPFPAEPDDGKLNAYLGIDGCRTMQQGVADTLACFDSAQSRGVDLDGMLSEILEKGV